MRNAMMLPERVILSRRSMEREINSFSSIQKDACLKLKGTKMQRLGYAKTAKKHG